MRVFYLSAAILLSLAASAIVTIDVQSGWAPDGEHLELYRFGVGVMLVAWLVTDPKLPRELRPTFDHGFLHLTLFPLLAFHQQYVTRRWWGVGVACGLLLILLWPSLVWMWIALRR